jgi:hypothetical protein
MTSVVLDDELTTVVSSRVGSIELSLTQVWAELMLDVRPEFYFEIAALDYGEINAEGRWEVLDVAGIPKGGRGRDGDARFGATPFADLLGATVESFSLAPPAVFELALSSGVCVRFYDDSKPYESVTIHPGDYVI